MKEKLNWQYITVILIIMMSKVLFEMFAPEQYLPLLLGATIGVAMSAGLLLLRTN